MDGLIDAIMRFTAVTISNNYMTHHDKVMLLGHSDSHVQDKNMQVTISFNHFGEDWLRTSHEPLVIEESLLELENMEDGMKDLTTEQPTIDLDGRCLVGYF
ncbi:hypothetical protein RND71_010276 [Anisodus tanguticus]|uniref:Pectate lyase domain-containing protein n=1 Tax=Anisodus tanguticus TaxID=243964 RepID=A0AAE1SJI3_9SOLA|nr:hypothetical protein RND71_010276 [Anisodus tanguticus]